MKSYIFLLFICSLCIPSVTGQNTLKVTGIVFDSVKKEGIENAVITFFPSATNVVTDKEGRFTCTLAKGRHKLALRHIGYKEKEIFFIFNRDTTIRIALTATTHILAETTVTTGTQASKGISGTMAGRTELNMEQLKSLPKFLGSNDPLKILQLTPGVQTSGDANSGLFIRGGESGHNLILWNDAPVYNASHLLGFFSVFNSGHVSGFKLHKSDMSAAYGGRLSSLISVESPDCIPDHFSVEGNVGLISSQATLAVPVSQKSAFYLSGRKTYIGVLLKPILEATVTNKGKEVPWDYEFQDANFTFIYRPSVKDKIVVNAFAGSDAFELSDPEFMLAGELKWSNILGSVAWEHVWENHKRMKQVFFATQYKNKLFVEQSGLRAKLPSSIQDIGYRNEFDFKIGNNSFRAGAEYTNHRVRPQSPQVEIGEDSLTRSSGQLYHTHEATLFFSGNFKLTKQLTASLGLRYTGNFQTGPYDDILYDYRGEVIQSTHYKRGEPVCFYGGLDPRITLSYVIGDNTVLLGSYNRNHQFINLVSISGVGLLTDFWVPASKNIPPQTGDNFALGYFRSLRNNNFEVSLEVYYRKMTRQMEFNSVLFDLFNQQYLVEESINYGRGRAYGAEVMLKKNQGKLTGWVSYTIGQSKRYFPAINNGKSFPAKHDRRHDLSVTVSYDLNKKWDFSSVFVFATGSAFTMPNSIYSIGGNIMKEYGAYNGARLPNYQRLDLSATYWFVKEKHKESGLNFSLYNACKRNNPLYVLVAAKPSSHGNDQVIINKKYKRLYDIMPSISWIFRF